MSVSPIRIKKSPFVFLKYVLIIELVFAFGPIVIAQLIALDEQYDASAASAVVSYPILITLIVVVLQVLIIGISFAVWYFATYVVDEQSVLYQRGGMFGDKELAKTPEITGIDVRQGPLARRLNYGTLSLLMPASAAQARIQSIANPQLFAESIQRLVDPIFATNLAPLNRSPIEVIAEGENQFVEFKASLVWDYRQLKANKALY